MKSTVALLRWVLAQNKWAVGMAVLLRGHWDAFAVVPLTFVQQLRKPAPAPEVNAELVEQPTVEEVVLLCNWWRE